MSSGPFVIQTGLVPRHVFGSKSSREISGPDARWIAHEPHVEFSGQGEAATPRKPESVSEGDPANSPTAAPLPPRTQRSGGERVTGAESALAMASPEPPSAATLTPEQHRAERMAWRHGCDWLQLHRICRHNRCRRAGHCRSNPVTCLRAGVPRVPRSARDFVLRMMKAQELDLPFEDAFEDATDYFDGWEAWVAGLAARRRGE